MPAPTSAHAPVAGVALSPAARELYRALGALPAGLAADADLAAAVCALPWERAHTALDELADADLTEPVRNGGGLSRQRLTPAAHAAARAAQPDGADEHRTGAALRVSEWLLVLCCAAWHRSRPDRGLLVPAAPTAGWRLPFVRGQGQRWVKERLDLVETVLALAWNAGWDGLVWQIADALYVYFEAEHPLPLWRESALRGLDAARRCGHASAERRMLRSLAVALAAGGDEEAAAGRLTELARLARADGDRADEARAAYGLGLVLLRRGDHPGARDRLLQAADLFGPTSPGTVAALTAAAEAALGAGDADTAAEAAGRAHTAATASGDPTAAWALALRGRARHRLGRLDAAVKDLLAARGATPAASREREHVLLLTWLAEAHTAAGDTGRAEVCTKAARALDADPAGPQLADDLGPQL
ncbi:hypothetical protein [Streptomyces sp. NPDC059816]|uniref:hypothetical protein n=1 Tax=Streptomyces sp. NPDC059816 TaxID=3346960 RepID=UPI00365162D7